ncbi:MAG TPA: hypothetical protein DDY31_07195 [Lachnospiraceae bacterium]|nr:hypothetical protein [Lachnospiraceae bacterium]
MKALYARQSLDKKDSLSIEGQIEQCKIMLRPKEDFKEYTDKGFSGKNTERPALNELLKDIESGLINGVIVYRLDRFSRNITDFYNLYEIMKRHNCDFQSVNEKFDTSTPMGRAMMGILITFAQMERESIQERVKDNYYYRIAQDGRWAGGPAPYGFKNAKTADNKPTLKTDKKKTEAVILIFRLYTEEASISLGKVAKILTEKGYQSNRTNGAWDTSTISKILQNTVYVKADEVLYQYLAIRQINFLNKMSDWNGLTSCHIVGKRVGNSNIRKYTDLKEQSVYLTNFTGIIDSKTYINAMNRLEQNEQIASANKPGILQELGGKLKCSCGYAIKAYSKSTNGRPYLDCYANRSLHSCKHKYNKFNFYDIQQETGIQIQEQLNHLSHLLKKKQRICADKKKEIKNLQKQLDNLLTLASKMSDELQDSIIDKIEQIQKQINELQLHLQINADIADSLQISQFQNTPPVPDYNNLSLEEKKYLSNLFIQKIVLHEDTGQIEIFWKL